MSLYQQNLRKEINSYDLELKQTKTRIQETELELKNETNVFEKVRLMQRLRTLRTTIIILEINIKNALKQIH